MSEWTVVGKKKALSSPGGGVGGGGGGESAKKAADKLEKKKSKARDTALALAASNSGSGDTSPSSSSSAEQLVMRIRRCCEVLQKSVFYANVLCTLRAEFADVDVNVNVDVDGGDGGGGGGGGDGEDRAGLGRGVFFSTLVGLGIGSFATQSGPLLQLALVVCLQNDVVGEASSQLFSSAAAASSSSPPASSTSTSLSVSTLTPRVVLYDPVFSELEKQACAILGLTCSCEEDSKRLYNKAQGLSLFVMPHCPYFVYCDVLWENWSNLSSVVIIGNTFSSYATRNVLPCRETTQQDMPGGGQSSIALLERFLIEKTLWIDVLMSKELMHGDRAFNDMSLMYVSRDAFSITAATAAAAVAAACDAESGGDVNLATQFSFLLESVPQPTEEQLEALVKRRVEANELSV